MIDNNARVCKSLCKFITGVEVVEATQLSILLKKIKNVNTKELDESICNDENNEHYEIATDDENNEEHYEIATNTDTTMDTTIRFPLIVADTPFQASYLTQRIRSINSKIDWNDDEPPLRFVTLFDEGAYMSILPTTIPLSLGSDQIIVIGGNCRETRRTRSALNKLLAFKSLDKSAVDYIEVNHSHFLPFDYFDRFKTIISDYEIFRESSFKCYASEYINNNASVITKSNAHSITPSSTYFSECNIQGKKSRKSDLHISLTLCSEYLN